MFRYLIFAIALIVAGPVLALSCAAPNLARTFNHLDAEHELYVIALGEFHHNGPLPELKFDAEGIGQTRSAETTFSGQFLNRNGVGSSRDVQVTVNAVCIAAWCGSFPVEGQPVLVFLERLSEASYVLDANACGAPMEAEPTQKQIQAIQRCMRRGSCSQREFDVFSIY